MRVTILLSVGAFVALAPFAGVDLPESPGFILIYQTALASNDVITALLLFAHFAILGSRGLLVLAAGYLFTALVVVAHMATFPGT